MDNPGDYLRKLRGKRSLREVAKEMGISHTYLRSLELGFDPRTKKGRKPSLETMRKLANYYNVSYREMLDKFHPDKKMVMDEFVSQIMRSLKKLETGINEVTIPIPIETKIGSEVHQNKWYDVLDLYYLLNMSLDEETGYFNLFYKGKPLTDVQKQKVLSILKTLLE